MMTQSHLQSLSTDSPFSFLLSCCAKEELFLKINKANQKNPT